jgi:hypothetical protein
MPHDTLSVGIHRALEGLDSRDRVSRVPNLAWELRYPRWLSANRQARTASTDAAKRVILRQCAAAQPCYIVHHDEPPASLLNAGWLKGPYGEYRVPALPTLEDPDLVYWLFALGNWQLWVGPPPSGVPRFPDTFRTDPVELERWFRATGYTAFIDSFHDDDYWLLFINAATAA